METSTRRQTTLGLKLSSLLIIRAGFLALCSLSPCIASAQFTITDHPYDKKDGSRLEVRSVFDPLPPTGYAPMRVVVVNGRDQEAQWNFQFSANTTHYRQQNVHDGEFSLVTPARQTGSAMFLVPLAVQYGGFGGYNNQLSLQLTVTSSAHGPHQASYYKERTSGFPAIAISRALSDSTITQLNDAVQKKSRGSSSYGGTEVFGSRFDPADLPEDWLAFSGFDFVLLGSADWQVLKPGVRTALLQWVRLGGKLHVYVSPGGDRSLGLLDAKNYQTHQQFSLGGITAFTWDGRSLPVSDTVSRYWGADERLDDLVDNHTRDRSRSDTWKLIRMIGERSFASWQVVVFLLVFGILVGPVNLFVLAPPGRRHKLFFTTPLLSLGASALMIVLILFQDGLGGNGRRLVVVNLEPAETTAFVTQKQISRSGVLLSSSFEMKQPALVEPLALPDTDWVKLKNTQTSQPVSLSQNGRARSGNYFQSRTEQAQAIRAAVSTRARVELKAGAAPDAPPTVISALGFTVETLFFADEKGTLWQTEAPLVTGQQAALVKSTDKDFRDWWSAATNTAGGKLQDQLASQATTPAGKFFATAKSAPGFTQETLPSIHWQDDQIVVFGTMAVP